jgi:hypothetical protein
VFCFNAQWVMSEGVLAPLPTAPTTYLGACACGRRFVKMETSGGNSTFLIGTFIGGAQ